MENKTIIKLMLSLGVILVCSAILYHNAYKGGYNARIAEEGQQISEQVDRAAKAAADAIACNNDPNCRGLPDKFQRD